MAMRKVLPLCARLADVTTMSTGLALSRTATQVTAGSAAAVCIGRHHFATSGEGASLRQSADQHLQEGGPEERPVPDSTAINQQAPLSSDDKGEPQVGKVSTPDGDDEGSPRVSSVDVESDDVVPNLQTPKE